MTNRIIVGVDAGGTFTDFVVLETGDPLHLRVHKTLSTPDAPERAILDGLQALGLAERIASGSLHVIHGSTVATNAALEHRNARTAFITNRGFGDMLTLARQTRPALYALEFPPRLPPVPEELCFETGGRIGADGSVLEPLGHADLKLLVEQVAAAKPQAVAINLLFSFRDSSFEEAIEQALLEKIPQLFVSRSSAVLPEYKEYERGITTWLNASLGPVVSGYIKRLKQALAKCSLQIMQSSGETLEAGRAADAAARLLLSGPAGGLTAMQYLGRRSGNKRIISFDMGGTSTDVALLDGSIAITNEGRIADYPVAVPMVDMHTIGAGGGSIAYVDSGGLLQVGPQSAGALPGPACYGRGGIDATVTDANLVLGHLLPDTPLAGDLHLDLGLAQAAIARLAEPLGLSVRETAAGIVRIANEHMAEAIRHISVYRGHDPKEFLLTSFGGAGGLHVCALAEAMQMNRAMVPVHGGVLSALGMVVSKRGRQYSRTLGLPTADLDSELLAARRDELEQLAREELVAEGAELDRIICQFSMDMRYLGQSYTLTIPWQDAQQAHRDYHQLHASRYGYKLEEATECVNLRLHAFVNEEELQLPAPMGECNKQAPLQVSSTDEELTVYQREQLAAEQICNGPALILEYSATTYVARGWQASLDAWGNLILQQHARTDQSLQALPTGI